MASTTFDKPLDTEVDSLREQIVSLNPVTYSKTVNGITWIACKIGKIMMLTATTGSLTNAITVSGTTLISLSNFTNDWSSLKFAATWQNVVATAPTKRMSADNNTENVVLLGTATSGEAIRGEIIAVLQ